MLLMNVRPWGGPAADITIDDGVITAIDPAVGDRPGTDRPGVVDGRGLLALPGLTNAHAHVDKTWWGKPWVSNVPARDLNDRIALERRDRARLGLPDAGSIAAQLREYVRHGTTAIRSHVDVDLGVGLRGLEAVREAEAEIGAGLEIELIAFPQDGVLRRPGVDKLLDDAAAWGLAQYIGGLDPATIDRDPVGQLDLLFDIAERHGTGIDIHLHDRGDLGAFEFELIIERTRQRGLAGKVTIAHGFGLATVDAGRQRDLIAELADAGVALTTVAPMTGNQLPVAELTAAGVPLGLGTDGVRDLWMPHGDGDMLRLAGTLAARCGWRSDDQLEAALRVATNASFVGRTRTGLTVGARADVVLVDAETVAEAVVAAPRRELVLAGGREIVRGGRLTV